MKHNTTPKAVICNETNEFFFSLGQAAKKFNTTHPTIAASCNGEVKKVLKGYTFRYATEEEIASVKKEIVVQEKSVVKGKGKRGSGNTEAVFNFSTGDFYTSATDTAEHLGVTQGHVSYVCRTKGRTVKGNKLCYVKDIPEHLSEIAEAIHKGIMYDEYKTKEDHKKELIANLKDLEEKANHLANRIRFLTEELTDTETEIEKAKLEILHFVFN